MFIHVSQKWHADDAEKGGPVCREAGQYGSICANQIFPLHPRAILCWHMFFTLCYCMRLYKRYPAIKGSLFSFFVWMTFSCNTNIHEENKILHVDSVHAKETLTQQTNIPRVIVEDTMNDPIKIGTEQLSSADTGIHTGKVDTAVLVQFAETLTGIPYVWASTDPQVGFDCSGFITYVFNHFNIAVPRSSIDFMNVGRTVSVDKARPGDFILFTGTNPLEENIGHMGLVVSNNLIDGLQFIHATSGKAMAVTITKLNEQYLKRFIRISRIFK